MAREFAHCKHDGGGSAAARSAVERELLRAAAVWIACEQSRRLHVRLQNALFLRALSLFHIVLPILLLWMLDRLSYDPRAPLAQTLLAWIVLPVTYAVVRPGDENINWVYGLDERQKRLPPLVYLALVMLAYPLGLYLPTHFALNALFVRG